MNGEPMKHMLALAACALSMSALAAEPKYDASILKETSAFLQGIDKVLQAKDDGFDLKRRADHSRWGLDLKKRAEVFLGTGPAADKMSSPFRPCYQAVYWATEVWSSRMTYDRTPSKINYDGVQRWTKEYQSELKHCSATGT